MGTKRPVMEGRLIIRDPQLLEGNSDRWGGWPRWWVFFCVILEVLWCCASPKFGVRMKHNDIL
jgi:hypothetical protein